MNKILQITLCCVVAFGFQSGCKKREKAASTSVKAPKGVELPKTVEQEYVYLKKKDYVLKSELDLDALELQIRSIRENLGSMPSIDALRREEILKGLSDKLDYADAVLDQLRMSAKDGWKTDQKVYLSALEDLSEACKAASKELGLSEG